jgi:hypothetical protein
MRHFRSKIHMTSSSCSLVTAVKPNAIEKVRVVTMLLFYIIHKYYPNKS